MAERTTTLPFFEAPDIGPQQRYPARRQLGAFDLNQFAQSMYKAATQAPYREGVEEPDEACPRSV